MGVVYEGWDPELHRSVAIKVLSNPQVGQAADERFRREARAIAALRHPNIVKVFDFGRSEGTPFIVMELVEGLALAEAIETRRHYSLERKLRTAAEVCSALQHAHAVGVIHRDIKPANIHLGDDGVARLLDFGVAHLADSVLTLPSEVLGTPAYLAPEMLTGQTFDGRADLYSLAAVMYEWMTFERPHATGDIRSLLRRVLNDPVPNIVNVWPECPPPVAAIVRRGLQKDPDRRYADAAAFRVDLLAAIDDIVRTGAAVPSLCDSATVTAGVIHKITSRRPARWLPAAWLSASAMAAGLLLYVGFPNAAIPPRVAPLAVPNAAVLAPSPEYSAGHLPPQRLAVQRSPTPIDHVLSRESPTTARAPAPVLLTEDDEEALAVPVGTPLIIRITSEIRTDISRPGDEFSAELQEPVIYQGLVVASAGALVRGRIAALSAADGRAAPFLDVLLTELQLMARATPIRTGRYRIVAPATTKGTAVATLVVGAAVGAILGGVAAGTKGVMVGAASGAGVGALASRPDVATVYVLGDRLTFKLAQPIALQSQD